MQHRDVVEFNGITFIRFPESKSLSIRRYFYPFARGRRVKGVGALHQAVWVAHFGPIPKGYEIHHKDENPLNNDIANLECLTRSEHGLRHGNKSPAQRRHFERIRPLAAIWHGSSEGRAWHAEHGRQTWDGRRTEQRVCLECQQPYESKGLRDTDKFCSSACCQRWHYRNKTYFVEKPCPVCGTMFLEAPGKLDTCCSRSCGMRRSCARRAHLQSNG